MAIEIKTIPVLKGKSAKAFVKRADNNIVNKGTIDFSQQVKAAHEILKGFYSIKTQ